MKNSAELHAAEKIQPQAEQAKAKGERKERFHDNLPAHSVFALHGRPFAPSMKSSMPRDS